MQHIHKTNLAWAPIDAAKPHLSIRERDFAFVTIGADDAFAAINGLVRLIAANRIPLRPQLAQLCRRWLDSCFSRGSTTPPGFDANASRSRFAGPKRSERLGLNELVRRPMAAW